MAEMAEDRQAVQLEKVSDEVLTEWARQGDAPAFEELVRRHRVKAFSWAARISRDPHMSEDIVQEALIRAFLKLDTLVRNDQFVGWLRSIVRNQALMKLRRGGPYGRELPVSSYPLPQASENTVNLYDISSIMDFLIARSACAHEIANAGLYKDPQLHLERQEWYRIIKDLLRCLNPREKSIFENYFFEQCSPQEIAEMFQISVGNVYKIISRSRQKVQEERLSFLIRTHIQRRKEDGFMKRNELDPSPLKEAGGSLLSGTEMLYRFVRSRYPHLSLSYVDGFLLGAFIVNIEESRVDMSSTNMIDRNYLIMNGMLNLGIRVRYVEAFDFEPPDPRLMTEAIALAQSSIDSGMPAMVWELLHSEFGFIYGYDDDKQQFNALDTQADGSVSYDRLGRLQTRSLFLLGVVGEQPITPSDALWRLCRMISRHARGGDETFTGFVNGLAAYDTWLEVFRKRAIDPIGQAYTIGIIRQNRNNAVLCLEELAAEWEKPGDEWRLQIHDLLRQASQHYADVAKGFDELATMFPPPSGGEPNDPHTARTAMAVLERILASEESGVQILEQIAERLEEHAPRGHVPPIIEHPPRAYVM
ncbi:RNA polymerase sigma factor [Paenibacillus spongiae]|uniref:Sigma-70 family RNA polymerase sigma factor n=1 Tax=Paenibacillus spongiae TaxID=2909671 RepID=A0ABY5SGE2_9BACL|nr:sigma-70 family RNA polymerase sigma factor [Paenibacillus spongiae]UVI33056.1 sigma-70 family RNA polymerase sigma factor [Paenibacillus spongiae]